MPTPDKSAVPTSIQFASVPPLATCSVDDLRIAFARARLAVALAKYAAARSVARARTLTFVSLLGR